MKKLKLFLERESQRRVQAQQHKIKYMLFSSSSKYVCLSSSFKNHRFHFGTKKGLKVISLYYQNKEKKGYVIG